MPNIMTSRRSSPHTAIGRRVARQVRDWSPAARTAAAELVRDCRARQQRTLRQYAEQRIVLPSGPYKGRRWQAEFQPFAGLILDELDRRHWPLTFVTGCVQSGKTLLVLIPLLHGLFETCEGVIFGLPDLIMAADKWREDILPTLKAAGYERYLPLEGAGSRGGRIVDAIRFRGAGTLKFMSGGGGGAQRKGYTARVLIATEIDEMDEPTGGSDETDKLTQMIQRTGSYADARTVIGESIITTKRGRMWRELKRGTDTRIACPCPECGQYVTLERQHLTGWQGAPDVLAARNAARWICPACGIELTDDQRREMNHRACLLHRGQRVCRRSEVAHGEPATPLTNTGGRDELVIAGPVPPTDTFSVRWNAFNNMFWTAQYIAALEWMAANDPDPGQDNPERDLCQNVWAIPYEPQTLDVGGLDWRQVVQCQSDVRRGHIPLGCTEFVLACDLGKRLLHWVAMAMRADGSPHVVDYSVVEVQIEKFVLEHAMLLALRELRDLVAAGWPELRASGEPSIRVPDVALVDSGWLADTVYEFVRESAEETCRWLPAKGTGAGQGPPYRRPKSIAGNVTAIGEGYNVSRLAHDGVFLVEIDADAWKTWLQERVRAARGTSGAITLFHVADAREHLPIAKHWSAEIPVQEYVAGKGLVTRWDNTSRRPNHYFDAGYMAGVACRLAAELHAAPPAETAEQPTGRKRLRLRDGRAWLPTQR